MHSYASFELVLESLAALVHIVHQWCFLHMLRLIQGVCTGSHATCCSPWGLQLALPGSGSAFGCLSGFGSAFGIILGNCLFLHICEAKMAMCVLSVWWFFLMGYLHIHPQTLDLSVLLHSGWTIWKVSKRPCETSRGTSSNWDSEFVTLLHKKSHTSDFFSSSASRYEVISWHDSLLLSPRGIPIYTLLHASWVPYIANWKVAELNAGLPWKQHWIVGTGQPVFFSAVKSVKGTFLNPLVTYTEKKVHFLLEV